MSVKIKPCYICGRGAQKLKIFSGIPVCQICVGRHIGDVEEKVESSSSSTPDTDFEDEDTLNMFGYLGYVGEGVW